MFRLRMCCLLAAAILSLSGVIRSASSQPAPAGDDYTARIQTIFDGRCIACHSCYNAPCQLNLQSHSGVARGATKLKSMTARDRQASPLPGSTSTATASPIGAPRAFSTSWPAPSQPAPY
jgi:hypothetical protein